MQSDNSFKYIQYECLVKSLWREKCVKELVNFVLFLCLDITFIRNQCCCMLVNFVLFLCLDIIFIRNQYSCIFLRPLIFEVWFVWSIFKKGFVLHEASFKERFYWRGRVMGQVGRWLSIVCAWVVCKTNSDHHPHHHQHHHPHHHQHHHQHH